jgi:hypothetical protein
VRKFKCDVRVDALLGKRVQQRAILIRRRYGLFASADAFTEDSARHGEASGICRSSGRQEVLDGFARDEPLCAQAHPVPADGLPHKRVIGRSQNRSPQRAIEN